MLPILLLTLAAEPSAADVQKADENIHRFLGTEVLRLNERFMDGARTKEEWEKRRPRLHAEMMDMLGLSPLPERTDLAAKVTGRIARGNLVIENIHFQSKPGLYVTGNLYRPKVADKPLPTILYVCGHSGRGRDGNKTAYQDHGLWFASNGYVCLMIDTLQLGEVAGKHHGTYNLDRFWWQSMGYTPAGVECWNGIRAIDYLCTRPEVDKNRIGVTGISGGGASTVWIAAADERVKVAVPVSGMSDLDSYVNSKVINGHCDCMFYINTYQWEWTTALALFAPRPLLFANSDNDRIFPMDGNRRIMQRLNRCYEILGHKENVAEYVSVGDHAYRPDLRVAIFRFINKHLKNDSSEVADSVFPKIDGKDLRVFPEDGDLPKDAINARADELFVPIKHAPLPTDRKQFAEWKKATLTKLREMSFRSIPADVPSLPGLPFASPKAGWIESQPGVWVLVGTVAVNTGPGADHHTLHVVGSAATGDPASPFGKLFTTDDAVTMLISPRGIGKQAWTRKSPPNTVERSMALLGSTVDTGRVRDVMAVLAAMQKPVKIAGTDQSAVIAAYAAILSPKNVSGVVLDSPSMSHRDGPHFLNVLRTVDVPEALGLLAPDIELTIKGKNAKGPAWERTAAIYRAAGAEEKFKRE